MKGAHPNRALAATSAALVSVLALGFCVGVFRPVSSRRWQRAGEPPPIDVLIDDAWLEPK